MMFIFLSLLELAVIGFMSRNEGAPRRVTPRKRSFELDEFAWKEMPSPRIGLRQVDLSIFYLFRYGLSRAQTKLKHIFQELTSSSIAVTIFFRVLHFSFPEFYFSFQRQTTFLVLTVSALIKIAFSIIFSDISMLKKCKTIGLVCSFLFFG